jgi:hypothetical protein
MQSVKWEAERTKYNMNEFICFNDFTFDLIISHTHTHTRKTPFHFIKIIKPNLICAYSSFTLFPLSPTTIFSSMVYFNGTNNLYFSV